MLVWTVANQKGGVGKTTTTVSLAGLCTEQNLRVLVIDMDPHGSLSSYLGCDPDLVDQGCFTLFQQRKKMDRHLVHECIQPTEFPNLSILPASLGLATLERQVISQDGMGLVISRALKLVADDFDMVLIDCPPILGVLLINALAACQQILIPVQTEFLAIKGLQRMTHTLDMLTRSLRKPLPATIVATMFDRRTQASVTSLRQLRNSYPESIWPGMIPVDTKLRDASKAGMLPNLYQSQSRAVEAYRSLFKWLAARSDDPLLQHTGKKRRAAPIVIADAEPLSASEGMVS